MFATRRADGPISQLGTAALSPLSRAAVSSARDDDGSTARRCGGNCCSFDACLMSLRVTAAFGTRGAAAVAERRGRMHDGGMHFSTLSMLSGVGGRSRALLQQPTATPPSTAARFAIIEWVSPPRRAGFATHAGIATVQERLRERRKQGASVNAAVKAIVGRGPSDAARSGGGRGGGGHSSGGSGGGGANPAKCANPLAINTSLIEAKRPQDVLSIVSDNLNKLTVVNLSTAFSMLGKMATSSAKGSGGFYSFSQQHQDLAADEAFQDRAVQVQVDLALTPGLTPLGFMEFSTLESQI